MIKKYLETSDDKCIGTAKFKSLALALFAPLFLSGAAGASELADVNERINSMAVRSESAGARQLVLNADKLDSSHTLEIAINNNSLALGGRGGSLTGAAAGVNNISSPSEGRLGGVLSRKGIPTGYAGELKPTLDDMQSDAVTLLPTASTYFGTTYALTEITDPSMDLTGKTVVAFNGKRYYYTTPTTLSSEKADMLNYLSGSTSVALTSTGATAANAVFKTVINDETTYYTFDTSKLPKSGYAWNQAGRLVNLQSDGASSSNYDVKVNDGTTTNYYNITIDPNKADHNKGKTVWTETNEEGVSGYTWTDNIAGSKVTVSGDNITGAIRLKTPHNGTVPAANEWNKYFTYTYTKPTEYDITQTRINDTIATDGSNVQNKVFAGISSSSNGGAIHNTKNLSTINIISDFVGNSALPSGYAYGGAISNYANGEGTVSIGSIAGNFVGNSVSSSSSSSSAYGGAISNRASSAGTASIGSIVGDFVGNSSISNGGAISNYAHSDTASATIGSIVGDFVGNSASSSNSSSSSPTFAYGGAIYSYIPADYYTRATSVNSSNSIISITGDFVGNSASRGGAIYLSEYSRTNKVAEFTLLHNNSIQNINGDFIGNSATATSSDGGAIYIGSESLLELPRSYYETATLNADINLQIRNINGDFIRNYAQATSGGANGGAIAISIKPSISKYYSTQTLNVSLIGEIQNITGDFVDNYASSSSSSAYGGAIFNSAQNSGSTASIGSITGDFVGNSASGSYSSGGAIYNNANNTASATIGSIVGDFVGNSSSSSSSAYGGAIYNNAPGSSATASIGSIVGDFVGNSASSSSSSAYGGAIFNGSSPTSYSSGSVITLAGNTFTGNYVQVGENKTPNSIYNAGVINIKNGATVTINDGWQSHNNAQLVMGSGSTLNMNIANGTIQADSLGKFTKNGTFNATFDIDFNGGTGGVGSGDSISTTRITLSDGSGIVTVNGFNFLNGTSGINKNTKIQLLKTQANGLKLVLSPEAAAQLPTGEFVIGTIAPSDVPETIAAATAWNKNYQRTVTTAGTIYGTIGLATTTTTDDSIGVTQTRQEGGVTTHESMGDTLKLVNQDTTNPTKDFTAGAQGATYTVTENLGATKGTVYINGISGGNAETVNLNGKTGFELGAGSTALYFNNVTVGDTSTGKTPENTTIATVTNKNATIGLNNAIINGAITGNLSGEDTFAITTSGTTRLNGVVTKANITNTGNLTTTAENIAASTMTNNSTLNLSGALGQTIYGAGGTTKVNGSLALNNGANIDGGLDINGGTLTVSSGAITSHNVGSLTDSGSTSGNFAIDLKYENGVVTSDTINLGSDTTPYTLKITSLNEIGGSTSRPENFTTQILTGTTGKTKLDISAIESQFNSFETEQEEIELTSNTIAYNDNYGTYKWDKTTELTVVGSTSDLYDTLKYTTTKDNYRYDPKAENLSLINSYSGTGSNDRKMTFDGIFNPTTGSDGVYTMQASTALGETKSGKLTLDGVTSGERLTTVDLNGNNGFNLTKATELVLNNIDLKGSNGNLISGSNSGAKVVLNNSITEGNIVGTGATSLALETKGDTTLKGASTNVSLTNSGTLTNNGAISGTVTNNGTMTSSAENISAAVVTNNNLLNLNGALAQTIGGDDGTTYVNGNLTLNNDAGIDGTLNLNNGAVTVSAGSTTNHNIGALEGKAGFAIDYNTATGDIDTLTLANDTVTEAIVNVTSLDIGSTPIANLNDFTAQVLINANPNTKLTISEVLKEQFEKTYTEDKSVSHELTSPTIKWNDKYGTEEWTETYKAELGVNDVGDSIEYKSTKTSETEHIWNPEADNLALINQYAGTGSDNRTFNFDSKEDVYKVKENVGSTTSGELSVIGKAGTKIVDGKEVRETSTIDFQNHDGFNMNNDDTTLTLKDVGVQNANFLVKSANESSVINLDGVTLKDNGDGIRTSGTVNITGKSDIQDKVLLTGDSASINVKDSDDVKINSRLYGMGSLNVENSTLSMGKDTKILGLDTTFNNSKLNLESESSLSGVNTTFSGTNNLNASNGSVGNLAFGNLNLNGLLRMQIDADLANKQMDKLMANSVSLGNNAKIDVSKINLLSPTTEQNVKLLFTNNKDLARIVNYTGEDTIVYSPIYKYKTNYEINKDMGYFSFASAGGSDGFNPSVLSTPVMAQAGMQANMNATMNYAFQHSDGFTKLRAMDRFAAINANKYALNDSQATGTRGAISTDFNQNLANLSNSYENKGAWFRPYVSFENVNLKNGPRVDAISFGSLAGFDTNFKELKHGWNTVFTGYLGYNGAHLNYKGVSTMMNGGVIGGTQTWYKGNFWTALTATTGASVAESDTMYGHESNASIMAGVGSKTGYNFEFKQGRFIIQPIWFMNYSMIKTFDYTNAAGVRINSDPIHTIQLNPSVRFIGNLNHGWQPYASVGMVWNLMNETQARANGVKLPEMSVKPYVEYGVGVQKQVGDRFTGFFQAMMRNGGRNGIALTGGFRWALGRDSNSKPKEKVMTPDLPLQDANAKNQFSTNRKVLKQVRSDRNVQNNLSNDKKVLKSLSTRKSMK